MAHLSNPVIATDLADDASRRSRLEEATIMTRRVHRFLSDVADYYAEPEDRVEKQSNGKSIFLLVIFALLIAVSVGYFVVKTCFPSLRHKMESLESFDDSGGESYSTPNMSTYQPPKSREKQGALV
jgi:hypothetical protein